LLSSEAIMTVTSLILFLVIGGVAGWAASQLMRGRGLGLVGNIVVGIVGAVLGGWVLGAAGIAFGGLIGSLVTAFLGAVLLLFLVSLIKKV
jgi:uncharacterized membrane protein YeaQ/YmgE (transglycosylase-associated protein family)